MSFTRYLTRYPGGKICAGLSVLCWVVLAGTAIAAENDQVSCIGCHVTQGLSSKLASGEILSLTVDAKAMSASVHKSLYCTACHRNIQKFPHPKNSAFDYRDFRIQTSKQCQNCHPYELKQMLDSNHARVLAAGNRDGAVCVDCHGSHMVEKPEYPRYKMSTSCGNCHRDIYKQYIGSAHGKGLLETSNPDLPGCADCHTAHKQEDPKTYRFRLKSPSVCGRCHGNPTLMRKYNLSTQVFNTYVSEFHGRTVMLFEQQHPDQLTNTAVCTDCHGVHGILEVSDANSTVIKQNLLSTCRRCHPDASANFPDSWVGHFVPTRDRYPLVFYVNLFYKYVIPMTIGGMLLFVFIDAGGRVIRRLRKDHA
jgi:nitrate/TMAO reductase-like tetraheme cytochrome c subunit